MAGEDWLAAIVGGLQGGVDGLQFMRRSKQEDEQRKAMAERQRMQDALAAEDREERRLDREQQRRDRSRTTVSTMLEDIGRGGRLAPEQAAGVRDVGLGHRLEDTPDFQNSYFAQAGPVPMMLPEVATTVAPTAAERLADQERKREQERRAAIAAGIGDPYERQAFEADPTKYKPTRESFLPTPIRLRETQEAEDAKIDAEVRKSNALFPIKMREMEESERLQAKYRPPSASSTRTVKVSYSDPETGQMFEEYLTPQEARERGPIRKGMSAKDLEGGAAMSDYVKKIDDAIALGDKTGWGGTGVVEGRVAGMFGGKFASEEALQLRALIGDLFAENAHERFGGALTAQEIERAKAYLAEATDDPKKIRVNLQRMKNVVAPALKRWKARQGTLPAGGVTVPDPRGGKTADPLGIR